MHRMPCWNSVVVCGLQQPAFVRKLCWWVLFIVRGEPGVHAMCPRYILSTDRTKLVVCLVPARKLLCPGGQPVLHSVLSWQVLIFSVRQHSMHELPGWHVLVCSRSRQHKHVSDVPRRQVLSPCWGQQQPVVHELPRWELL
jgi:hypothetical protein